MKNKKTIIIISILVLVLVIVALIIANSQKNTDEPQENATQTEQNKTNTDKEKEDKKNPIVTMQIKDYGEVKIELYPDIAPNTVANFISLVKEGYYDGIAFHRIVPGFVVQAGIKNGATSEATEYAIKGEFSKNGVTNNLSHKKGVISMARADYSDLGLTEEGYNSAYAQFFIVLEDQRSLNGLYAAFGQVTEGMDIIDSLANIEIDSQTQKPINPPVIEKMTVDTFGIEYKEPERIKALDINKLLGNFAY